MGGFGFDSGQLPPTVHKHAPFRAETKRKMLEPRDAAPEGNSNSKELIQFLREGPPQTAVDSPSQRRVSADTMNTNSTRAPRTFSSRQLKQLLHLHARPRSTSPKRVPGKERPSHSDHQNHDQDHDRLPHVQRTEVAGAQPFRRIVTDPAQIGELDADSTYRINDYAAPEEPQPFEEHPVPDVTDEVNKRLKTRGLSDIVRQSYHDMLEGIKLDHPHLLADDTMSQTASRRLSPQRSPRRSPHRSPQRSPKKILFPRQGVAVDSKLRDHGSKGPDQPPRPGRASPPRYRSKFISSLEKGSPVAPQDRVPVTVKAVPNGKSMTWSQRTRGLPPLQTKQLPRIPIPTSANRAAMLSSRASSESMYRSGHFEKSSPISPGPSFTSPATSDEVAQTIHVVDPLKSCPPSPAPRIPLPPLPENSDGSKRQSLRSIKSFSDRIPSPERSPAIIPQKSPARGRRPMSPIADASPKNKAASEEVTGQPAKMGGRPRWPIQSAKSEQNLSRNSMIPDTDPENDPFQWRIKKTRAIKQRDVDQSKTRIGRPQVPNMANGYPTTEGGEDTDDTIMTLPCEWKRDSPMNSVGSPTASSLECWNLRPEVQNKTQCMVASNQPSPIFVVKDEPPVHFPKPPRQISSSSTRTTYRSHSTQYSSQRNGVLQVSPELMTTPSKRGRNTPDTFGTTIFTPRSDSLSNVRAGITQSSSPRKMSSKRTTTPVEVPASRAGNSVQNSAAHSAGGYGKEPKTEWESRMEALERKTILQERNTEALVRKTIMQEKRIEALEKRTTLLEAALVASINDSARLETSEALFGQKGGANEIGSRSSESGMTLERLLANYVAKNSSGSF